MFGLKVKKYVFRNPRCEECNLFMSWEDARERSVTYTPFGGPLDLDPPDERFIHRNCWEKLSPEDKARIRRIAWIQPNEEIPSTYL